MRRWSMAAATIFALGATLYHLLHLAGGRSTAPRTKEIIREKEHDAFRGRSRKLNPECAPPPVCRDHCEDAGTRSPPRERFQSGRGPRSRLLRKPPGWAHAGSRRSKPGDAADFAGALAGAGVARRAWTLPLPPPRTHASTSARTKRRCPSALDDPASDSDETAEPAAACCTPLRSA